MKKLYNFRLETNLMNEIDKLDGNRTEKITNAINLYLQNLYNDTQNIYSNQYVKKLEMDNDRLWKLHTDLVSRISYLPEHEPAIIEPKKKHWWNKPSKL